MWQGCEWRHARKWWAGNFGDFWKKTQLVEIWTLARAVQLGLHGMRRPFVGSDGTVSIVKIVSLSPRVENLKLKKLINLSYLNKDSRQCFGISMHTNILHIRILNMLHLNIKIYIL